jgi:hypothetical protein
MVDGRYEIAISRNMRASHRDETVSGSQHAMSCPKYLDADGTVPFNQWQIGAVKMLIAPEQSQLEPLLRHASTIFT